MGFWGFGGGHVTYARRTVAEGPRDATAAGVRAWPALRCGAFGTMGQHGKASTERFQQGSGPVRRGRRWRRRGRAADELILRCSRWSGSLRSLVFRPPRP